MKQIVTDGALVAEEAAGSVAFATQGELDAIAVGQLERLRGAEVATVRSWFKPGMRVLDLGGGSGYQASVLAALNCDVLSIDVADRPLSRHQYHTVQDYDGRTFPAADASFDIIFSSNVLEHIPSLSATFDEIHRALKPDGLAIHVLPTAGWRFWTSVAHFGFVFKYLTGMQRVLPTSGEALSVSNMVATRGFTRLLKRVLPLNAHGEYPNAVAELYYFSAARWRRVFEQHGFEVIHFAENKLFYTGYALFPRLSLQTRRQLAGVLGSACHIFVMQPAQARPAVKLPDRN